MQILPTYIEIPRNSSETGVQDELQHWGCNYQVYRFGLRSEYLCIDPLHAVDEEQVHYMLCHDDLADADGAILHTGEKALTTNELMKLLYQIHIHEGCRHS